MAIQSVGSVQFGVEQKHLLKIRMSNFYFVNLGLLAHVMLVWCGVRATGLTTGQVQDVGVNPWYRMYMLATAKLHCLCK